MNDVVLVEVGPRDGFQAIKPFIPTARKIEVVRSAARAGMKRIEIGSFVNPSSLPQMADIHEIVVVAKDLPGIEISVLVPNRRGAQLAWREGVENLVFVVSASESHNRSNVRRSVAESMTEWRDVLAQSPHGARIRFNVATAFDCPFENTTPTEAVLAMINTTLGWRDDIEICLCDTTGKAMPNAVSELFEAAFRRFPEHSQWAYHAHDTYGFGVATVMAAYQTGVRVFDASIAGLGGCPFAPGATGNVASEDLVYAFGRMGITTGVNLDVLVRAAREAANIDGAVVGGHYRIAWAATQAGDTAFAPA